MNDKVKSLFFSQYLGQKFIVTDRLERKDRDIHVLEEFTLDAVNIGGVVFDDSIEMDIVVSACALLLRDISQLSEAELFTVSQFCQSPLKGSEMQIAKEVLGCMVDIQPDKCYWGPKYLNALYQYLLRIGVILPFTYLSETNQPITLTPAEIIKLGWAKIKSNEQ